MIPRENPGADSSRTGEAPRPTPRHDQQEQAQFDRAFSELMYKRSHGITTSRVSSARVTSVLLAISYVVSSGLRLDAAAAVRMAMFCVLPLACIWLPDTMSSYVGGSIDRGSPRRPLVFFAWIVFLIPLFRGVLWYVYRATDYVL